MRFWKGEFCKKMGFSKREFLDKLRIFEGLEFVNKMFVCQAK